MCIDSKRETNSTKVMKANEAPEKIYLLPDDRNPNGLSICWYEAPYVTGAIEYTRTDAFIEKAIKWLKEHAEDYDYTWYNEFLGESGITDKCIDEFKNYIKGE